MMDEALVRVGLIAGALAVAAIVVLIVRLISRPRPRAVDASGFQPGVYLFTSAACPDCEAVRQTLGEALGEDGFEELAWEDRPEVFSDLDVDAVPATLIVGEAGSATLWTGRPDDALASLGP